MTPLQMATVAATVANGGMRMKPQITSRIVDEDGRTVERIEPEEAAARHVGAESAEQLTQMMANVVREGTGTAAALEGIEVAGKTGTAELNIAQRDQPAVVRRLRAALAAEDRDRGDARERRSAARAASSRRRSPSRSCRSCCDEGRPRGRRRHRRALPGGRPPRHRAAWPRSTARPTCSSGARSR